MIAICLTLLSTSVGLQLFFEFPLSIFEYYGFRILFTQQQM